MSDEIQALEKQIASLNEKLARLRKDSIEAAGVPNYTFDTITGSTDLKSLFCCKDVLFAIHNMGQCCRYCTLWADGLNGFCLTWRIDLRWCCFPKIHRNSSNALLTPGTGVSEWHRMATAFTWTSRVSSRVNAECRDWSAI